GEEVGPDVRSPGLERHQVVDFVCRAGVVADAVGAVHRFLGRLTDVAHGVAGTRPTDGSTGRASVIAARRAAGMGQALVVAGVAHRGVDGAVERDRGT